MSPNGHYRPHITGRVWSFRRSHREAGGAGPRRAILNGAGFPWRWRQHLLPVIQRPGAEWLEPDGLGGFASGTVSGIRTRRYHALLLAASTPPTGRFALVNGFEAWVQTPAGRCAISSQAYLPGVVHPDGAARCVDFSIDPWPRWTYRLDDGTLVEQEIFLSLIHISEPTRLLSISYAVFCLKKKKTKT